MKIESLDNKQIKLFEQLKQKKYRTKEQKFVVEGVHLVELALLHQQAGYVFIIENEYDVKDGALYKGETFIADISCPYAYISPRVSAKLTQTMSPQGIYAICSMQHKTYDGTSIVFFDGVSDPGNVGTIMRSANAFDVHNFYFTADAVDPYNDKVIRASQGAIFFSCLFFQDDETSSADLFMQELKDVYALDIVGTELQTRSRSSGSFGLIVGNEARGMTYARWDAYKPVQITIPMNKQIESLNVAVATSIALYELR
jgi:TrmH family RNA methyltransferase